jgi:uncharacterized membrane protein YdjX (TVP38/TMEM64 family)
MSRHRWKPIAVEAALAVAVLASAGLWFGVHGPQRAAHEIAALGDHTSTRILFTALYATGLAIGLPVGSLSVVGGAEFGWGLGFALDFTAIVAGAAAGYTLAHRIGAETAARILHRRHGWLARVDPENHFGTLVGLQVSPLVPNGMLNLAAGAAGIDFKRYMASVIVGNALPTLAYSYLGGTLVFTRAAPHTPLAWVIRGIGLAVTLVILAPPLYAWAVNRRATRQLPNTRRRRASSRP